ncbi:MAG: fructose 1,6-bisphosphatase [Candidatus Nealsonbacteria bacterium CG03_land_8_20_14_0_80_36_12]|uniref:Fructose-1,6-bisphosphate aldolase/phosphatase n=1 Tax=Candidatus Nealsonbacteria bacterium CG03_land_8_20_14_0_80_36_12 TaxID=1974701 RepID=A0A2M7BY67_9BACT|nr:MAG: fructose 1,6-bisphosphatase [Candidatus Nealsonbacteria bacterium CG03_land_8_20_14_0_80_36_12]
MKTTLSIIKADIGSIGGHIKPSQKLLQAVKNYIKDKGKKLIIDYYVGHTGDDITILTTHKRGVSDSKIHKLCWDAFLTGTKVAKLQGLYGAGQDLLKSAFSGNVKGMGPCVAEMEFEEREAEPFLMFMADKTEPGAYNLPLYLSFTDPMYTPGFILSPRIQKGFKWVIMDVAFTKADKIIELKTPEETYEVAALLRDNGRFVVESIWSRASREQVVAASTTRLHNIAGKYVGKDDPVMLVRTQKDFPATGEILAPYTIGHLVSGFMRGSHTGPLMPVRKNSPISFFDGPPVVSCLAFSVKRGQLTEPADCFDHPYWDYVRNKVSQKAEEIRRQGFSGPAMLPMSELEYTGVVETLKKLEKKFIIRKK